MVNIHNGEEIASTRSQKGWYQYTFICCSAYLETEKRIKGGENICYEDYPGESNLNLNIGYYQQ